MERRPRSSLALPQRVSSAAEAVQALKVAETLCLQLSGLSEQGALRFPALLKASLLEI